MSREIRALLANRRFAIPLIALLGIAFVGLILVGVILITRPGTSDDGSQAALATSTSALEATERPTTTALPSATVEPSSTPTLVPLGTPASPSETDVADASTSEAETPSDEEATAQPTPGSGDSPAATATAPTEDELADTGVGWGLIVLSAIGLSGLVLLARRLRLA
jgi:hypothetical protein